MDIAQRDCDPTALQRRIEAALDSTFFDAKQLEYSDEHDLRTEPSPSSAMGPVSAGPTSPRRADPAPGGGPVSPRATLQPCNGRTYAAGKALPADFLRSVGLSDIRYRNTPAVRTPYHDAGGVEVAVRTRSTLDHTQTLEDRKGRPARVCLGEAMPEESAVLPPPEVLHC